MIESFRENPLLLLFVVIAIGYWIGSIRIRGTKLGVAAVLFVGLGFGAMDANFMVPEIVIMMGLSIFVYTVGLSSGPAFFASFQREGFRDFIFVLATLLFTAAITAGLHFLFHLEAATTAGLFAGSTTNTPALAGLLDAIQKSGSSGDLTEMSQRAVVGYSLSYPMGVLGVMFVIWWMQKLLRIDYREEEVILQKDYPIGGNLSSRTVRVTRDAVLGMELRDFLKEYNIRVVFGRLKRDDAMTLSTWDTVLQADDQIVVIGGAKELEAATGLLGEPSKVQLTYDRSVYDVRRLFVSNPKVAGEKIATLNLSERFSALITRVQRGDMDLLASGDTVLELGDRVLLVAKRKDLPEIFKIFGNSYEALSTINLMSFGLGMALGLLLGMINFELSGGISFNLGFAGGPLIIALILGSLRRTGPIVWTLPYSANLTLRQVGLILLLAGIGIRSGATFLSTIQQGGGGLLFLSGAIIACTTTIVTLLIGFRMLRIPFSFLTGMVGSQPAVLDYAIEQAGNKYPNIGFTRMLPVALIGKILFVQILFNILKNM